MTERNQFSRSLNGLNSRDSGRRQDVTFGHLIRFDFGERFRLERNDRLRYRYSPGDRFSRDVYHSDRSVFSEMGKLVGHALSPDSHHPATGLVVVAEIMLFGLAFDYLAEELSQFLVTGPLTHRRLDIEFEVAAETRS
jgi:hypothetical protein